MKLPTYLEVSKDLIQNMCSEITLLALPPHLPGCNKLTQINDLMFQMMAWYPDHMSYLRKPWSIMVVHLFPATYLLFPRVNFVFRKLVFFRDLFFVIRYLFFISASKFCFPRVIFHFRELFFISKQKSRNEN